MTNQKGFDDRIVDYRRDFHRFPELSGEEIETARRVSQYLQHLKIPHRTGVAGHGILAEIEGVNSQRFIALRADMDALPIHEETGLSFSSENAGVMHACGHDGHMSILLGAAELLSQGEKPPCSVRLIFQPAEEVAQGAKAMVEAGALKDVSMIFGGHLDRHYPAGTIVVSDGPVNASSDLFTIELSGQSAHGARPHESTDVIVIASLMVMAIQTLVSREVDPARPSVVSVGEFHAGTAANVIAGKAQLRGTIRAQHEEVRQQLHNGIRRISRSIAELHQAAAEVEIISGTPPLHNEEPFVSLARKVAMSIVGEENVLKLRTANMGAEDFSFYLEQTGGCYVRYGAQAEGKEGYPAHSSRFDIDERALSVAARFLADIAREAGRQ